MNLAQAVIVRSDWLTAEVLIPKAGIGEIRFRGNGVCLFGHLAQTGHVGAIVE